jgi:hypothetical protein
MRNSDTEDTTYERRDARVIHEGWQWYYHTREGRRGPFDTRNGAVTDLGQYVDTMAFIEANPDSVPENLDLDDIDVIDLKPPRY